MKNVLLFAQIVQRVKTVQHSVKIVDYVNTVQNYAGAVVCVKTVQISFVQIAEKHAAIVYQQSV